MKKSILILTSLFTLFSCGNDDDTQDVEKPTFSKILIDKIDSNTSDEIEIELNEDMADTLQFEISTNDNIELSQLQVEIHEALDAHSHARLSETIGTDTLSFGPKIYDLSGTNMTTGVFVTVPKTVVHGEYHLECVVLDKSGNRTENIVEFHLEGHEDHDDHEH